MARYLWVIAAALNLVSFVVDIMTGAPTFEHEVLMMLMLALAKLDEIEASR